jgi:hypothetical protein
MFNTALYLGTGHPSLLLVGESTFLAFGAEVRTGFCARGKSTDSAEKSVCELTEQ